MVSEKQTGLEQLEKRVRRTTNVSHPIELNMIGELLQTFIDGFNLIGGFKLTDDNEIQYVWLLLLAQTFRSMRTAYLSTRIGYYGEALSLLRLATESWFCAEDCKKNPRTVKALIHDNKLQIKIGNLADAWDKKTREVVYGGDYEFLSRFTHPCKKGLATLIDPDTNKLCVYPDYSDLLFMTCCESLIRNAIRIYPIMLELISSTCNQKDLETWTKLAVPRIKRAGCWQRDLAAKYEDSTTQYPND